MELIDEVRYDCGKRWPIGRFRYLRYRNGLRKRRCLPKLPMHTSQAQTLLVGLAAEDRKWAGSSLNQILVEEIGKLDEPTPRYTTVQDVHRYEDTEQRRF